MEREFTRNGAHRINEATIRDAFASIQKLLGEPPTISFEFGDGGNDTDKISSTSVDEVLGSANTRTKYISKLAISGSNYKAPDNPSAGLYLEDALFFRIRFKGTGSDDATALVKTELDDILAAAREPYSWLYPRPSIDGASNVAIGFLLASLLVLLFNLAAGSGANSTLLLASLTAGSLLVVSWLKRLLFPRLTFDIGRSKDVSERAKVLRHTTFVVLGIGLAVSIAAGLILRLI